MTNETNIQKIISDLQDTITLKDDEIKRLKRQQMFFLNEKQETQLREWAKNQKDPKFRVKGYIGETAYEFTFIPTSIGNAVKVKNTITGEELDLTDYGSW